MARRADLIIGAGVRWRSLLGLLVAVLVAHALVFDWLARQWVETTALRPLVAPMFTRLLQPQVHQRRSGDGRGRPYGGPMASVRR